MDIQHASRESKKAFQFSFAGPTYLLGDELITVEGRIVKALENITLNLFLESHFFPDSSFFGRIHIYNIPYIGFGKASN